MNNEIASFLDSGYTVDHLQAVKGHNDKKAWFISAHVVNAGGSVIYPTWASTDLDNSATVYAVDADSHRVTPRKSKLAGASASDPSVKASKDCARKAAGGA